MANEKLLWEKLVSELQKNFESVSYDTWIAPVEPISLVNGVLTLELPSAFHRDYWDRNLVAESETILQDYTGQKIRLDLTVPNENHKEDVDDPVVTGVDAPGQVYAHDTHLNDKYTFDSFVVGSGNYLAQAAALSAAEEPGQVYNPLNLYGGVGLGKTHLMQAIGHEVLRRNPEAKVKYVTSEEFANDFINCGIGLNANQCSFKFTNISINLAGDVV